MKRRSIGGNLKEASNGVFPISIIKKSQASQLNDEVERARVKSEKMKQFRHYSHPGWNGDFGSERKEFFINPESR
jgi:hypothetical protein